MKSGFLKSENWNILKDTLTKLATYWIFVKNYNQNDHWYVRFHGDDWNNETNFGYKCKLAKYYNYICFRINIIVTEVL